MESLLVATKPPRIQLCQAPEMEPELEGSYLQKLQEINQDPHLFNGGCSVATEISPELISAYSLDYARGLLYQKPPGGRFLSVGCRLFNPEGEMLWSRRGMHVALYPDLWEPGISGTLEQVSDPEELLRLELQEELGVDPEIRFMGLSLGEEYCQLTWAALIDADQPRARPPEVTKISWLPEGELPEGAIMPHSPHLITSYFDEARRIGIVPAG